MNRRIGLALMLMAFFIWVPVAPYFVGADITELLMKELIKSEQAKTFHAESNDAGVAGLATLIFGAAFFASWGTIMLIFALAIQLLTLYLVLSREMEDNATIR